MADGQVARRVGRVTAFGAFLDSTLDRYSDLALYMGLVVYYTLAGRPFYMTLAAVAMASSFMVSYSRARAESLIPSLQSGIHGAARAAGAADSRRCVQPHGAGALGDRHDLDDYRDSSRRVYLAGTARRAFPSRRDRLLNSELPALSILQRFFDRLRDDILHALAQGVHIAAADLGCVNRIVQIDRNFPGIKHPVARLKKFERSDDAHRHDRHAEFLRQIEDSLLEGLHVAIARA